MIKVNDQKLSSNQAAKVVLRHVLNICKVALDDSFLEAKGVDLSSMTSRERAEFLDSIDKWAGRLTKGLNINFPFDDIAEQGSDYRSGDESDNEEELTYYKLKSGGFGAVGYYHEE